MSSHAMLCPAMPCLTNCLLLASREIWKELTLAEFKALLVAVPQCEGRIRMYQPSTVYPFMVEVQRRFQQEYAGSIFLEEGRQMVLPATVTWAETRVGTRAGGAGRRRVAGAR
jgi:hypothetical protein